MQQYIGFKLNDSEFTIPILKVREIINTPQMTRLPQAPHYLRGIINLRGRIVPVLDLKELVSMGGAEGAASKVIVISGGKSNYGILVDAITSVVNLDETTIESPEGFMQEHIERVEGVARLDDRLIILLDTDKLIEAEELEAFGEDFIEAPSRPQPAVEAGKKEDSKAIAGEQAAIGTQDPREALKQRLGGRQKGKFINSLLELLETLDSRDFDAADVIISEMMQSRDGSLYKQVGHVTRKLHDSIKAFKSALDPRIKQIANEEVPNAVDRLEFVLDRTADAANRTMEIVEKYYASIPEIEKHVGRLKSPKATVAFFKEFKDSFRNDLTDILVAQEYQDIIGQTIRRVIDLVNSIETELVGLIATFGVKMDLAPDENRPVPEKITQEDVEDLLREFGF